MENDRRKLLALYWMEKCVSNSSSAHNACAALIEGFVPSRLLDVESVMESGTLRLVHARGDDQLTVKMKPIDVKLRLNNLYVVMAIIYHAQTSLRSRSTLCATACGLGLCRTNSRTYLLQRA